MHFVFVLQEDIITCKNVSNAKRLWADCSYQLYKMCNDAGMDAPWSAINNQDIQEIMNLSKIYKDQETEHPK